uniref:Uncharacterized protein n=1 Tax=Triticum urartu TaxID=4572 RepID=A0A8R7NXA2_TRIUA
MYCPVSCDVILSLFKPLNTKQGNEDISESQSHCLHGRWSHCHLYYALCGDKHMTSKGPCPPPNTMDLFIINT